MPMYLSKHLLLFFKTDFYFLFSRLPGLHSLFFYSSFTTTLPQICIFSPVSLTSVSIRIKGAQSHDTRVTIGVLVREE